MTELFKALPYELEMISVSFKDNITYQWLGKYQTWCRCWTQQCVANRRLQFVVEIARQPTVLADKTMYESIACHHDNSIPPESFRQLWRSGVGIEDMDQKTTRILMLGV